MIHRHPTNNSEKKEVQIRRSKKMSAGVETEGQSGSPMPDWQQSISTLLLPDIEQWKQWIHTGEWKQWIHTGQWKQLIEEPTPMQLYVALAILVVTSLFFLIKFSRRSKPNTVVLTGLSGSGKTVLFYEMRDGSSHLGTVTSMEQNEGTFVLHSELEKKGKVKPVHVVDVPGHYRLRPKLDEGLPQAGVIIFVVDSLDFLPNIQAVAEYLYDILTKASVVKRKIPMLIVCNKTDKVTAHSKEFIKKQLEKELEKLRTSRNAVSDADIKNEFTLGVEGQPFNFSHSHNKVTVTDASGLTGEISHVELFIREHIAA